MSRGGERGLDSKRLVVREQEHALAHLGDAVVSRVQRRVPARVPLIFEVVADGLDDIVASLVEDVRDVLEHDDERSEGASRSGPSLCRDARGGRGGTRRGSRRSRAAWPGRRARTTGRADRPGSRPQRRSAPSLSNPSSRISLSGRTFGRVSGDGMGVVGIGGAEEIERVGLGRPGVLFQGPATSHPALPKPSENPPHPENMSSTRSGIPLVRRSRLYGMAVFFAMSGGIGVVGA